MNASTKIEHFMTPVPYTICGDSTIDHAVRMMKELNIRHLPVRNAEGTLVGILSDRDIKGAGSLHGFHHKRIKVEDAMTPDPYTVDINEELGDVTLRMAQKKYGCTVIEHRGEVVGIFTATDALRLLAELVYGDSRPSLEKYLQGLEKHQARIFPV